MRLLLRVLPKLNPKPSWRGRLGDEAEALVAAIDVVAERNRLLLAGGFAPPYLEQPYDGEVMQPLRESLSGLLEAHEPNPP